MNNKLKGLTKPSDGDKELGYALAKGFVSNLSVIPIIGPMAAEAIGTKIPNVRMQRVETMVTLLYEYLGIDGSQVFNDRINEEDFRNLFEQAVEDAARAKTELRIETIAKILASSVSLDGEQLFSMVTFDVIESLSDIELTVFYIIIQEAFRIIEEVPEGAVSEGEISNIVYSSMSGSKTGSRDMHEVNDIVRFATVSLKSKGLILNVTEDIRGKAKFPSDIEWTLSAMGFTIMELTKIGMDAPLRVQRRKPEC